MKIVYKITVKEVSTKISGIIIQVAICKSQFILKCIIRLMILIKILIPIIFPIITFTHMNKVITLIFHRPHFNLMRRVISQDMILITSHIIMTGQ